eukprot:m.101062 g.101062  ORF g.101062 m.101062 type:complete len:132 (-) comp16790_c0_seq3:860-1255(-)
MTAFGVSDGFSAARTSTLDVVSTGGVSVAGTCEAVFVGAGVGSDETSIASGRPDDTTVDPNDGAAADEVSFNGEFGTFAAVDAVSLCEVEDSTFASTEGFGPAFDSCASFTVSAAPGGSSFSTSIGFIPML